MGKRILLVEDNKLMLGFYAIFLWRLQYACDMVGSVEDALDALENKEYECIITDIRLDTPKTGVDLIKTLEHDERFRNLPYIVCSVDARDNKDAFTKPGLLGIMDKPISQDTMARLLELIAKHEMLNELV